MRTKRIAFSVQRRADRKRPEAKSVGILNPSTLLGTSIEHRMSNVEV